MSWTNRKTPGTIAQPKTAPGSNRPVAPPVYRPQPVPKVLQRKTSPGQNPHPAQPPHRPVAPPVYRPQPKPAIAQAKVAVPSRVVTPAAGQTNSVVQQYTSENIRALDGAGTMSELKNYFIPDKYNGQRIYRSNSVAAPTSSIGMGKTKTHSGKTYRLYKSKKFLKDCLHTAEEINADAKLKPGGVQSRVVPKRKRSQSLSFGEDDSKNIKAARVEARDDSAAPKVGQAYVIVNTKWPKGVGYPYHAAGVVAQDGKDRITLEVFAGSQDAKRRDTVGKYSMYTTGSIGERFHSHWVGAYFKKKESATVIIEPDSP